MSPTRISLLQSIVIQLTNHCPLLSLIWAYLPLTVVVRSAGHKGLLLSLTQAKSTQIMRMEVLISLTLDRHDSPPRRGCERIGLG